MSSASSAKKDEKKKEEEKEGVRACSAKAEEPEEVAEASEKPESASALRDQAIGEGSTVHRFDDGSSLTTMRHADGSTSTFAMERSPELANTTTQTFDDGSTLTTSRYDNGSSFTYATERPAELTNTTTQTFDDGSTLSTHHYDNGSTLPAGAEPALEYRPPEPGTVWDATKMSPAQAELLRHELRTVPTVEQLQADGAPQRSIDFWRDYRLKLEGALDAYQTGVDPLLREGPLEPTWDSPEPIDPDANIG